MNTDGYTYLFYDKAVGNDHSYTNKITKNIKINDVFLADAKVYEGDDAIEEFNETNTMCQIPVDIDKKLCKIYLFSYSETGVKINIVLIAINEKEFENIVMSKEKIKNKNFLISLCNYHVLYNKASCGINIIDTVIMDKKIEEASEEIVKIAMQSNSDSTDPIQEQPKFAKQPLYDYQKRSIKWMLDKEQNPRHVYYNLNDEIVIGNVIYDTVKQDFILASNRNILMFNGGALIDEVGLGKTYQMITMSLCNQAKNINYFQEKYEKIFSKATLVICPNQLGCQWIRELENMIDKKYGLCVIPFFTKNHFDKYSYQDLLDADFVIVSFNFLKNKCFLDKWISELSTQKSYLTSKFYSHIDALELLQKNGRTLKANPECLQESYPNLLLIHWHRIIVDEFHEIYTKSQLNYVGKLLELFEGDYKWCMTATPFDNLQQSLINMINFVTNYSCAKNDAILANINIKEHMKKNFFRRNTKNSIMSEYALPPLNESVVWLNFSKTEWMMYNAYLADPNNDRYSVLLRQICCHPKLADEIKDSLSNCKTLDDIEKMMVKFYRKKMMNANSKVKYFEYRVKRLRYKINMSEFKLQKKLLNKMNYVVKFDIDTTDFDNEEIKKLEKELEDDPEVSNLFMGNDEKIELEDDSDDDDKKTIVISEKNSQKIQKLIGKKLKENPSATIQGMIDTESNFKIRLANAMNEYDGKKRTYEYYNDVMNKLKKTSENLSMTDSDSSDDSDDDDKQQCGICLGSVKGNDLGVTKCGHIFCYNCVKPFVESKNKCPMCQKPVKSSEIYMISKPIPDDEVTEELKDKQTLINKVGTKLANLIFYLKKNNEHSIIFSQWDDLLKKVGDVLDDYGIKNVFCKGNIWQRDKAIKEFTKNDSVKVIMLSSESSASGTNLTKAKNVILLDPVVGTYEYRRNTEWQAIGRAHRMGQQHKVNVIRFVVKGTVEEEIYNVNNSENKKLNVVQKIFEITDDKITLEEDKLKEIVEAAKNAKPKKITKKKQVKTKKKEESDDSDYSE